MSNFVYKKENGINSYYKRTRLFGKEKLTKVKEEDVYFFKCKNLREMRIMPNIEGLSFTGYMYNKILYCLKNHKSDFGRKVSIEINNFKDDCIASSLTNKITQEEVQVYDGKIEFEATVLDENKRAVFNFTAVIPILEYFQPTKEFYESLLTASFSGIYSNARDMSNFKELINKTLLNKKMSSPAYGCEECGEKFESIDAFLSHLIETCHNDSIFSTYPFDKELIRVKNIIENKKKSNNDINSDEL